jgi:hypothetical protein
VGGTAEESMIHDANAAAWVTVPAFDMAVA